MKFWDCFLKALIVEGVAVLIIILTALVLRFCFVPTFEKVSDWYLQNVLVDTDINEVIE